MTDHGLAPKLEPGLVLQGRYRIEGLLGAGGMAEVYRAHDTRIDRLVAIKILSNDSILQGVGGGETPLECFFREARVAARVNHPNAATIFDTGVFEARKLPFIVMTLVEGHDLGRELERGAMSAERAVPLLSDCLGALAEAHRLGIVHKDLKPSNLMLQSAGTARERLIILDFGVARALGAQRRTQAGQVLGTPQYMAPEYIRDQSVSPALDVYQMGLILVEMLTGAPVVPMTNLMACLLAHAEGDLPLPERVMGGALGPIVARALAFDPADRFEDAEALRAALLELYPQVPGVTGPIPAVMVPSPLPALSQANVPTVVSDVPTAVSEAPAVISATPAVADEAPERPSGRTPTVVSEAPKTPSGYTPTILGGAPRLRAEPSSARIVVYHDKKPVMTCEIVSDETLIGRFDPVDGSHPDVDLSSVDPEARTSRKHAWIYRDGARYVLYPVSSAGTQLGDALVGMGEKRELADGDIIILAASVALKFHLS